MPIPDDDLLNHPSLTTLESHVDLSHTCGYLSMLRTGWCSGAERYSITTSLSLSLSLSLSGAPVTGGGRGKKKKKPSNSHATNDQQKAEISEFLDDLRELGIGDPTSPPPDTLSSPAAPPECPTPDQSGSHSSGLTPVQERLSQEWIPLELSFGVPLFEQQANRAVCDKVSNTIL